MRPAPPDTAPTAELAAWSDEAMQWAQQQGVQFGLDYLLRPMFEGLAAAFGCTADEYTGHMERARMRHLAETVEAVPAMVARARLIGGIVPPNGNTP
jgi:hypothetical protein